jgi:hypothetical protein
MINSLKKRKFHVTKYFNLGSSDKNQLHVEISLCKLCRKPKESIRIGCFLRQKHVVIVVASFNAGNISYKLPTTP